MVIKCINKNIDEVNRFIGIGFMVSGFGVGVWDLGSGFHAVNFNLKFLLILYFFMIFTNIFL